MAWDPIAIYGGIANLSDTEMIRWVLEEAAADLEHRADMCRNPGRVHGPRAKPRPAEAALYETIARRLADLTPIVSGAAPAA